MIHLLWTLAVSGVVLALGLSLLLRWLGAAGLPAPCAVPASAPRGCEVSRRELLHVFSAALLFRLTVFLAVAALACLVLYPGTGLSWATDIWKKWDAWHYVGLAELGYTGYWEDGRPLFLVFFPLYPWLVRLVCPLTGHNTMAAGLMVSFLCYSAGCVYLYRLAAWELGKGAARRTVLFLSLFPYAFFFGGVMTEGLFLLTSVALAVSVVRLAQNRTLIHEMNAIETLARVDVLCVDKTGTVTSPQMQVREVVPLDPESCSETDITDILGAFYRVLDPDNDTAKAIADKFPRGPGWPDRGAVPFTSATKWSAVNFLDRGAYVVGAPEYILGQDFAALEKRTAPYAAQGCRVLLLAQCDGAEIGRLHGVVIPLALLVLENPIRPNAPKVFDYFHTQGVDVKVISGDNPVTVSAVAAQAGIRNAEQWVDARELQTDQDIAAAVREYTVFGRVVPNQKRKIVRALQSQGHTVAMTGDGVNDVLALKDADCGVAMASGADAACQVAQLVLLDSDFAAMPKVVAEGRRVINNIQRASALYLVKNILSFFLALITLFAAFPYPFVPIQLTLISALTIGVPSFFLALEPNHDLVKGKFLHNVLRRAFPGGLTAIFVILFAELFVYTFDLTLAELSTICVILMAVNGLMVIYYAARPLDAKRLVLLVAMSAAMFVAVVFYGAFFSLSSLSFAAWLVLIVLVLLVVPIQMGLEWCFDRCTTALDRRRERLAKRRRAPRRPRPAHRSRRHRGVLFDR